MTILGKALDTKNPLAHSVAVGALTVNFNYFNEHAPPIIVVHRYSAKPCWRWFSRVAWCGGFFVEIRIMVGAEGFVTIEPAHDVVEGEFIAVVPVGLVRVVNI